MAATAIARACFGGVARVAALGWIAPALYWNLDWSPAGSLGANISAGIMILATAGIIEGIRHSRSFALSAVGMLAITFLLFSNANTAFKNLAATGEAASDSKRAKMSGGSHLASQGVALRRSREAQAAIAGEKPVLTLEGEARALELSDPRRWAATSQCKDVTAAQSGEFCRRITEAGGKIAAAKERDRLDGELRTLNSKVEAFGEVPAAADAYAENLAAFLAGLTGKTFDDAAKRALTAQNEITRAISLELMAAVMPAFHLLLIDVLMGVGAAAGSMGARIRASARPAARREAATPADVDRATPATVAGGADDIDRWIADDLEDCAAGSMKTKDLRQLAHAWFASRGISDPAETELWSRLGARFKHDRNNNRPRYLGVRRKARAPVLVVSNSEKSSQQAREKLASGS